MTDADLSAMSREQLVAEVRALRAGIRAHRDSTGHELCWHHPALWALLPEQQDPLPVVPAWPEFIRGCVHYRQSLDAQLPDAPRSSVAHGAATDAAAAHRAVALANEFLRRVWGPAHDLDAIDELMTEDYRIWSGGVLVSGRPAFKAWVRQFQSVYADAHTEIRETFANAAGDRVVSRWFNTGLNHGIFGLAPDGRPVSFTGLAVWGVRDGRLAECWVERAAFESYRSLTQ